MLELASLGMKSYKDGVYRQIAADNPWVGDYEGLFLITLIFAAVFLTIFAWFFAQLERLLLVYGPAP